MYKRQIPEPPVIINTAVTFNETMQNKSLVITRNGILGVNSFITEEDGKQASPTVSHMEIRDGGQIVLYEDGITLVAANFTYALPNRNQWRAITLPPSENISITSDLGDQIHLRTGYAATGNQAWQPYSIPTTTDESTALLIAGDSPHATDTLRIESGKVELSKEAPGENGTGSLNTGIFLFMGNPASYNVEMRDIYVLSDDGSRFELRETATLRPFESYVVASAATRNMLKSLRLDGVVTGTDTPAVPTDDSLRAWAANGSLHLSANHSGEIYIYHVSGTLKAYLPSLRGETSVALPSGIYIVRQGETSIKVSL